MRKNIWVASFVFFGLVVCPAWALEGSVGFQAGAADSSRLDGAQIPSFGVNGYAFLDFKLDPHWSLGLGSSLSDMIDGTNRLYVDGTELYLRVAPWDGPTKPYLKVGAGARVLYEIDHNVAHRWWPGDFQASAELGILHPLDEGIDLNVSAFDDLSPGTNSTLNTLGLRAGLSFDFGRAQVSASPEAVSPKRAVVVAEAAPASAVIQVEASPAVSSPTPEAKIKTEPPAEKIHRHAQGYHWTQPKRKKYESIHFRWKKHSTLESVAAAAYGEPCDFPIIVDANKEKLGGPAGLKKGTIILLPQNVTSRDLEGACGKSEKDEYKAWNSVR